MYRDKLKEKLATASTEQVITPATPARPAESILVEIITIVNGKEEVIEEVKLELIDVVSKCIK